MSLFETLVVLFLGLYTLGSLYFGITGRVLNHRIKKERDQERKEDIERANKSLDWEEQVKALTIRMSQLATENERIAGENRKWQIAYNDLLKHYNTLMEKQKQVEGDVVDDIIQHDGPVQETHMKVSDKMDMEKKFGEEQ